VLLENRVRSRALDPYYHIRQLAEDSHPDPELLEILARVITVREDLAALDRFPAWQIFKIVGSKAPMSLPGQVKDNPQGAKTRR
jgi:hypothetical protein